jgi:hypothetical protein
MTYEGGRAFIPLHIAPSVTVTVLAIHAAYQHVKLYSPCDILILWHVEPLLGNDYKISKL